MNQRGELMVRAMNGKNAVQLYVGRARRRHFALHLSGPEDHVGIFWRLQDFPVHARVAGIISTFPAGGSDDNLSASLPSVWIEVYGPALQGEGAVDRVQSGVHCPMHGGLRRVEGQDNSGIGRGSGWRLRKRRRS